MTAKQALETLWSWLTAALVLGALGYGVYWLSRSGMTRGELVNEHLQTCPRCVAAGRAGTPPGWIDCPELQKLLSAPRAH